MKRNAMSLAAIAALALGGAAQAIPTQTEFNQRINHGRSPKEYGQMLQFNRRQKWTKSRL